MNNNKEDKKCEIIEDKQIKVIDLENKVINLINLEENIKNLDKVKEGKINIIY